MNITKRPSRGGTSYRVRVRVQGFPPISKTFSSKSEARSWGQQKESDLIAGKLGLAQAHHKTLGEAIDRFLLNPPEGYGEWLKNRNNQALLPWWKRHFGHFKLCGLKPTTIVQGRDRILQTPSPPKTVGGIRRPRAHSTVNRYVSALSSVLQACLELWGWIESNPARGVKKLPEKNSRCRILSDGEQRRLLKECAKDRNLRDVVLLALMTGGRRGEVCELEWKDVELRLGYVTFRNTKNGSDRSVPLCDQALKMLRARLVRRRLGSVDWVFPAERKSGPIDVSHRFARFCKQAGIEDFRFHDLRHCVASSLTRAGVRERQIQEILGHKTAQMTKRYSHLRPSELKPVMEVLSEGLERDILPN